MDPYLIFPGFATIMLLLQIGNFAGAVGKARGKFKVPAPKTDGPDGFLCTFRAHANALEFLPLILTLTWLGAVFAHPLAPVAPAVLYWHFRNAYFKGYTSGEPKNRSGPFYMLIKCLYALVAIAVFGLVNTGLAGFLNIDLIAMARGVIGA